MYNLLSDLLLYLLLCFTAITIRILLNCALRGPSTVQGYIKLFRLIHLRAEFGSINKHFDIGSIYLLCISSERFFRKIEYILTFFSY